MPKFRVGFIGTGRKPERPSGKGYAMAYAHADAYKLLPDCELVACADIVEENARAFAQTYHNGARCAGSTLPSFWQG